MTEPIERKPAKAHNLRHTIRTAVLEDVSAILRIERASPFAARWSTEQYDTRLRTGQLLVAEYDGQVGGFLCARVVSDEWEIENVVVEQSSRRCGIGTALIESLICRCREADGRALWLEVRESNTAARFLYENSGFAEVGRRRGYYRDPDEDAILYKLERRA